VECLVDIFVLNVNALTQSIIHMIKMIDVKEMLEAVKLFQSDEYVMTEEEAKILSNTENRNRPTIEPKSLPQRLKP
jgi:hypothetical protein